MVDRGPSEKWERPEFLKDHDTTPEAERNVPAAITRILSYYTHKDYGRRVTANLAPGADLSTIDPTLPEEVRQLYAWHNGYLNGFCENVAIIPHLMRLLSYEEAYCLRETQVFPPGDSLEHYWHSDIWPICFHPNLLDGVVVEVSTGRAGYHTDDRDLYQDMVWFDNLYDLFRAYVEAGRENKILVCPVNGHPVSLIDKPAKRLLLDVEGAADTESEDEHNAEPEA